MSFAENAKLVGMSEEAYRRMARGLPEPGAPKALTPAEFFQLLEDARPLFEAPAALACECGFEAKTLPGLQTHKRMKHAAVEEEE